MSADLKQYHNKRDFKKTPEPQGVKKGKASKGLVYVIQKHRASHLHFDLRVLLVTQRRAPTAGDGVSAARWVTPAELAALNLDPGILRALGKIEFRADERS